ncbi:EpsG family protein [Dryocola clanedunensis]
MFNLLVCCPFFFLLIFWRRFNSGSLYFLNIIIVIYLTISYTGFYPNGEDWANYYVNFYTSEGSSWFEPGFYLFFKALNFFSFGNFGFAILIYYLIAFVLLVNLLSKMHYSNSPLFFVLLIMCYGNTLVLEQLRQFYAIIFALYSIYYYLLNSIGSRKKYLLFLFLALSFHTSAVILFLSFFLSRIKNVFIFVTISLVCSALILILFVFPSALTSILVFVPQLALKLNQYLEITAMGLHLGPSLIISTCALIYFILNIRKMSPDFGVDWLIFRQIFIGLLIFMIGLYVPFAARFSIFYTIFLFLYISTLRFTVDTPTKFSYSKCYLVCVVVLFITTNILSYYKNPIAPIKFNEYSTHLVSFLSNDFDYQQLVSDIYLKNYENLNEYKDLQGK